MSTAINVPLVLPQFKESQWLSVKEYGWLINRPERSVYRWCLDGTFRDLHVPTHRDRFGQWWILHVPKLP